MWVRKRIDIEWSDLAAGVLQSAWGMSRGSAQRQIEQQWFGPDHTMACLSIRTGFDLLLKVLDLPAGSEVLMSAVTIDDMVKIVKHHDLVPVPVDLDMQRLAPRLDKLRQAVTPQTKAIVVAHLFGSRVPMEPILDFAREHGLMVIEDCAQAFVGEGYRGHPDSDVCMFSFGPIKTATALGGAVFGVRDAELLSRMRIAYSEYPMQGRWAFFRRLLKYCGIKIISTRWFLGAVSTICRRMGRDHDALANRVARGFTGPRFFDQIRKQPSTTLLALLGRRVARFEQHQLHLRMSRGRILVEFLNGLATRPGCRAADHSHWVFPVQMNEPRSLLVKMWQAGFDATQGQSHCVVPPPDDRPGLAAVEAERVIAQTVFLPFSVEMPVSCLDQMAEVVRDECRRTETKTESHETASSLPDELSPVERSSSITNSAVE